MGEEYLTVSEASRKLGVSPRTIQRYCKDGRLNHKWVMGKRHKELRILPPIQISHLPCGRRKNLAGTFDYITKVDFEDITSEFQRNLDEKDRRISILEAETEKLKSIISHSGDFTPGITDDFTSNKQERKKLSTLLYEFEHIRPAERKLILKLAKEVKNIEEQFQSMDSMPEYTEPDSE